MSVPLSRRCDTWGARPPSSPLTLISTNPDKILVHHTASANSTDYSQAHAYALARSIQNCTWTPTAGRTRASTSRSRAAGT